MRLLLYNVLCFRGCFAWLQCSCVTLDSMLLSEHHNTFAMDWNGASFHSPHGQGCHGGQPRQLEMEYCNVDIMRGLPMEWSEASFQSTARMANFVMEGQSWQCVVPWHHAEGAKCDCRGDMQDMG